MKIVHLCLSNFYIDGYAYQENQLVAQNVADGHSVTVIASLETFDIDNKTIIYLKPGDYLGADGARVIRLPYRSFLPSCVMKKLRIHPGVFALLDALRPDIVLFHGTCGWELNTVANYKKLNPQLRFFVDSHEDFNNSARTFASKWLLHYLYYRLILRRNINSICKVLCVNVAAMQFIGDFYRIPQPKIEFYPLGGQLPSDAEYSTARNETRAVRDLQVNDILFVQSGKLDRTKKLLESIHAFSQTKNRNFRFVVCGQLLDDIAEEAISLISKDSRISFEGWKTSLELQNLLCAADIYVQPGTQSATMQMSLCCRCVVVLDDVPSHKPFINGNGWLVGPHASLPDIFVEIEDSLQNLLAMAARSGEIASRLLDYKNLAKRLYWDYGSQQ